MAKKVESIKHKSDTRAHIPSQEEAGYEDSSPKVNEGKKTLELPKNPIVHRGQDPELFWKDKYGNDDRDDMLRVDIRSLYRHEHIAPETLIKNLYRVSEEKSAQTNLFNDLFGNALEKEEISKVSEYYHHQDGWTNRLIQGDSHLVMSSLLEREGMAGQVQMIYFDPPYGIKYGSNWQIKLNNRDVKDGKDEALTGEPEQIKAFRDTWEYGIHSYLSYLRDRLLVAKELLTESGSCFVQISDENVHLVRCLMDEVFGSENFIRIIFYKTTSGLGQSYLDKCGDYLIWYAKKFENLKFREIYESKEINIDVKSTYSNLVLESGDIITVKKWEAESGLILSKETIPNNAKLLKLDNLKSQSGDGGTIVINGKTYSTSSGSWKTNQRGIDNLALKNRISTKSNVPAYMRFHNDFPFFKLNNMWEDTITGGEYKEYVVQTNIKIIERCLLMCTDPGDLVLDPTCGSGTSAFIAEQWGRRWITIDTSRIALNIAKTRLMTAVYPYYHLYSDVDVTSENKDNKIKKTIREKPEEERRSDIRQGFVYEEVPHITLKSLANDEPPDTETLFDKPQEDKKRLRVSGPFTVETLQNFEPLAPEDLDDETKPGEDAGAFEEVIRQHLLSAGIKNGRKDESVIFSRVDLLSHEYIHAEGFYKDEVGEKKAYFHIGPKFGTVSRRQVNEAIKECRNRGDAQWLVILGFSFESEIEGGPQTTKFGTFEVTKARIHDDLLQEGLKKKPAKSAASFVTIGEPDIVLHKNGSEATVEIQGLDIYDPIRDEVKARNIADIAYWMVDDDYDGSNFIVKQVFFCGGDKDEFEKWRKGLSNLTKDTTKKKVEKTLKIEIDDEAFDRLYGHTSHPIEIKQKGQKIAVRVISQFGEEVMKVLMI